MPHGQVGSNLRLERGDHRFCPATRQSEAVLDFGIQWSTQQYAEFLKRGVDGLHFYTLNRSKASRQIVENLRHTGGLA